MAPPSVRGQWLSLGATWCAAATSLVLSLAGVPGLLAALFVLVLLIAQPRWN